MPRNYRAVVTIQLNAGETLESAEIDDAWDLGPHRMRFIARDSKHAEKLALDIINDTVAIGNLEAIQFNITVKPV